MVVPAAKTSRAFVRLDELLLALSNASASTDPRDNHISDPQIYTPYSGENSGSASVVIRTEQDPRSLAPAVRAEFAAVDPSQPAFDITTMQQRIEDSVETPRFNMTLLAIFASIALVLATVLRCHFLLCFAVHV